MIYHTLNWVSPEGGGCSFPLDGKKLGRYLYWGQKDRVSNLMYAFDSINANILIVSSNHFFVSIDRNIGPLMPILAIFKMTIRCTKPFVKSMLVFEKKN